MISNSNFTEIPSRRNNSLNFIRILAAFNVFYGHAVAHLQIQTIPAISKIVALFQGVPIFFIISGFLIWNSLRNELTFKTFCKKRLLRIFPELWVCVLLNTTIIIILYHDSISWVPFLLFVITQSTVLQFWTPQCLRGYGVGTPNGALWTICPMVQCYVALWVLHKIMKNKKLIFWMMLLGIFTACNIFFPNLKPFFPNEILYKVSMQTFIPYFWLFLLGAFLSEYFEYCITFLMKYWFAFFIGSAFFALSRYDIGVYATLKCVLLAPAIIGFSYSVNQIKIKYDFTYGFYLIHMVIINVMVQFGLLQKSLFFYLAFFLSLILAVISFFTVGAFSRRHKADIEKSHL